MNFGLLRVNCLCILNTNILKGKIMAFIISIEGTDGSGKQTQTALLHDYLTKKYVNGNVSKLSFPNYESPSSAPVRMYLGGDLGDDPNVLDAYQASSLFAVDRLLTVKQNDYIFGEENGIIILDRYVQSNMIHQAGKIGDLQKVDNFLNWVDDLEFDKLKLPMPNLILFLDMPVEKSLELAKNRGELKIGGTKDIHESNVKHLEAAYNTGHYVAHKYKWKIVNCVDKNNSIKTID